MLNEPEVLSGSKALEVKLDNDRNLRGQKKHKVCSITPVKINNQ